MTPRRDDSELPGPAQLTPPRVPVVRLNRRVLYVVGGVLVVAIVAGLIVPRGPGLAPGARGDLDPSLTAPARRRALVRQGRGPGAGGPAGDGRDPTRHAAEYRDAGHLSTRSVGGQARE